MANVFNLSSLFRENSSTTDDTTMTAVGDNAVTLGYREPGNSVTGLPVSDTVLNTDNQKSNNSTMTDKKTSTWDRESWSSYALSNNKNDRSELDTASADNSTEASQSIRSILKPVSHGRPSVPSLFGQGIMRFFSHDDMKAKPRRSGVHSRSRSLDLLLDDRHYEELNFEEEVTKMEGSCNKPILKPEFVDFYTKVLETFLHPLGKIKASNPNPLQLAAHLQKVFEVPSEIHVGMMKDELGNQTPACTLKVTVVEAKDILSMDANGMSDPYCLLTLCKRASHHSQSQEMHPHLTHWNSLPDDTISPSVTPAASHSDKDHRRNSDHRRSFRKGGRKKSDDLTLSTPVTKPRSDTLTVSNILHRRKNSGDGLSVASPKVTMHSLSIEAEAAFKTSCCKATLHPIWNETFDISVSSMQDTELILTMWDMDEDTNLWQACKSLESEHKMAGIKNLFRHIKHGINKNTDDFLGQVVISLADIPAATRVDLWYTLQITSKGPGPSSGGKCHIRLQFVREEDCSEKGKSSKLTYYHQLASTVYRYEGQKYINEGRGPWDGKLPDVSRHMLNCFAIQQGIAKLSQTLINLTSLLEFHHHQNSPAFEYGFSLMGLSMNGSGKDEVDSASVSSLPESLDNIQRAGEEKGEKDINRKPGEEKVKEELDASLMDRALREAMFHIHAEMIAETTFSIYSKAKDVSDIYLENPQFLSYELEVTESSISMYIDHCMSPIGDCPALFPPSDVQVLDILKSKCRLSNISSLLQMKVWKDRNSIPHQRVRKLLEDTIETDTRRWLSNMLESLPHPEGSLKPSDLLKLLEGLGDCMANMMALLRPIKDYQNFFMKFTVDYNKVVACQMDRLISASLQDILNQLYQYQVRYQKFPENIAESSKASLKLYMTVKKMYSLLKANNNHTCEGLEIFNYHTWFQEALIFWLVTFKYETFDRVRMALEMDKDVVLVHSVVKYSNSAVDAQSCFAKVTEEWHRIGFDGIDSRCMAITKITDLICEGAKLYAASIHKKLEQNGFYRSSGQFDIKAKLCITLNNIEHVRAYLDNLPTLLDWEQTVNSLATHHSNPTAGKLTFSTLQRMTTKASHDIINMSGLLGRKIADKMCQEVMKVLAKVVNPKGDANAKEEHLDEFFSYIDQNLETLYKQLMAQIFPRIVEEVWNALLRCIVSLMHIGKPPQYYHELRESLEALESYFQRPGLALNSTKIKGAQYTFLVSQLDLNSLSTHDLMLRYYKDMALDMATPGEYFGHLGVRMACKEETGGKKTIIIKVCNAVDLPGMDRNGTSDPYVVVEVLPETTFDKPLVQQTRNVQHDLNPVFDETFQIPSVPADLIEANGVMSLTVMDYDVLWSNDFIGEAFIPLQQARPISMNRSVDQSPVIMIPVKRPYAASGGAFEILKNRCKWDKNARQFYARRQKAIENQKPRTDKGTGGPPTTNARLAPFFRQ